MIKMHSSLLPNGLKDLLPPEAEEEARIITQLTGSFKQFGFRRVKPPLVEFEQNLLGDGPGKMLAQETFRLMDPISGHMMGVRADVTTQISRIANSRLQKEARPLRLCYASDVLRVHGTQLRPERQFCQVGCEIIGATSVRDDVEACLVALKSLHDLGAPKLSIDLTIPSLIQALFDDFGIEAPLADTLEAVLQKRERDSLQSMDHAIKDILIDLLDASGQGDAAITALQKIDCPAGARQKIDQLLATYRELKSALSVYGLDAISVTIDLVERQGFDYQTGVSFTIFSAQSRGELGRGGRYRPSDLGEEEATGFTLYMDSLTQIITRPDTQTMETLKVDASWEEIKQHQDRGHNIRRG